MSGGAIFGRLEGAWYSRRARLLRPAPTAATRDTGQVWAFDIQATGSSGSSFESPGADVLNMPDNIIGQPARRACARARTAQG